MQQQQQVQAATSSRPSEEIPNSARLSSQYCNCKIVKTPRKNKYKKKNSQKTPRGATHRGVCLRGLQHTAESSSAGCNIPRSQAPQFATHRGVKLRSLQHTAESSSAVCNTPRSQNAHRGVKIEIFGSLWLLLKGQSGEILLGVNYSIM